MKYEEIKKIFVFLRPYKKEAVIGGFFMFLNIMLLIPTPLITMYLIDSVLPKNDFTLLSIICSAVIILLLFKGLSSFIQNLYFLRFNELVVFDIRLALFEEVQRMPKQYRYKKQTGYLMSRITDDPNRLHGLFANSGLAIIRDIVTFIIGIVIIFIIHWKMALIAICLLPFYIFSLFYFSKRIRDLSADYFEKSALVTKKIEESISMLDTFIAYTAEKFDAIRLVNTLKKSIRSFIKRGITSNTSTVITGFISGLGPILIIWYGLSEIMNGNLTLGKLIAFNSFIGYLFGPTARLVNINISIQQSLAAWQRISELLYKEKIVKTVNKQHIKKGIDGNISFKNVSFSYDSKTVLKNINLQIDANTTIGIVGKSGCGKSTLASLILATDKPDKGEVLIDHIGLSKYDGKFLRRQIAYVDQEPTLFHDTFYNNIKLGNRHATDKDIISVAKMTNIHDFIISLSDGYQTVIDEKGINMSVGQKQRIAIARAVLRNPKILILDEPTSNLDSQSEKEILSSMKSFFNNRTSIIIAHRLSTLSFVDNIIVLDNGEIVENGTHNFLLQKPNGLYRSLWEKQHKNHNL